MPFDKLGPPSITTSASFNLTCHICASYQFINGPVLPLDTHESYPSRFNVRLSPADHVTIPHHVHCSRRNHSLPKLTSNTHVTAIQSTTNHDAMLLPLYHRKRTSPTGPFIFCSLVNSSLDHVASQDLSIFAFTRLRCVG